MPVTTHNVTGLPSRLTTSNTAIQPSWPATRRFMRLARSSSKRVSGPSDSTWKSRKLNGAAMRTTTTATNVRRTPYRCTGSRRRYTEDGRTDFLTAPLPDVAGSAPERAANTGNARMMLLFAAAVRVGLGILAIPLAPRLYREHYLALVLLRPTKEVLLGAGFHIRLGNLNVLEV